MDINHQNPSICIPRIFKHISIPFIIDIFQNKLLFGKIKNIDVVDISGNNDYKKIFIHFYNWYTNESAIDNKNKILNDETIKIVYDNPWFWKCSLNRAKNK